MGVLGCAAPAHAVEVGAGADRYSGSGGLLLPGTVDSGTRHQAAECAGCRWRLSDPCAADGGPCLAITRGCAQLASLLRIRLSSDGGSTWSDRGLVCIPPAGPITVADVAAGVRGEFERLVPELRPRLEPSAGVVTRIPVNFISGQPRGLPPSSHVILGQNVELRPAVRWSWDFGDGAEIGSSEPGEPYPAGTIRHAYRRAGVQVARVRAHWSGTFQVDGLGPFPVTGSIEQSAAMEVAVGEGRAVLVP
ncbi:MAG: hypothetical protein RL205_1566 [Actinomycetota bacterium]